MPTGEDHGSFDVFSRLGRAREVEVAVKHVLLSADELRQWCGGRVYCVADPAAFPDRPRPLITVVASSETIAFETAGVEEVLLTVFIGFSYVENRDVVEDTEPTVKSVVAAAHQALVSNLYLQVPEVTGRRLVQRIDQAEDVAYGSVDTGEKDEDGIPIPEFFLSRGYVYQYQQDASTGVVI